MSEEVLTLEMFHNSTFADGGVRVEMDGILHIGSKGFFILFSHEKIKIPIVEEGIVRRLLHAVPCYLGGENLYRDTVRVVATLQKMDGRVEIRTIESGVLTREEEEEEVYAF